MLHSTSERLHPSAPPLFGTVHVMAHAYARLTRTCAVLCRAAPCRFHAYARVQITGGAVLVGHTAGPIGPSGEVGAAFTTSASSQCPGGGGAVVSLGNLQGVLEVSGGVQMSGHRACGMGGALFVQDYVNGTLQVGADMDAWAVLPQRALLLAWQAVHAGLIGACCWLLAALMASSRLPHPTRAVRRSSVT